MEQNTIPDGYWEDARGCLIPVEQIKEIDKARDELVREKVAKSKAMQTQLRQLKLELMGDIAAFVELSAERYGAKLGGDKGNITLQTFDGRYRIKRQYMRASASTRACGRPRRSSTNAWRNGAATAPPPCGSSWNRPSRSTRRAASTPTPSWACAATRSKTTAGSGPCRPSATACRYWTAKRMCACTSATPTANMWPSRWIWPLCKEVKT